jgi:cysteine synthase
MFLRHATARALAAGSISSVVIYQYARSPQFTLLASEEEQQAKELKTNNNILSAIGNTPLVELRTLSKFTGCTILAKCEHLNPGGSIKDRAALYMVEKGERNGLLKPGSTIYEGTGGNTGVGLALVAAAKGYKAVMAMPASIAQEKIDAMQTFGASVVLTPSVPFTDQRHYFHRARDAAAANPQGFWCNQFDNLANLQSHYYGTAPELWKQSNKTVTGFVCACGTGGTLAGITTYLKEQDASIQCYLADPHGSALFDYVKQQYKVYREETVSNHTVRFIQRDNGTSITEGIGIGRVTGNFTKAAEAGIDGAFKVTDQEAIEMAYYLKEKEGVYVGPSAALNVVAAVKLAQKLGHGNTVVTVLCDGGARYKSKIFTPTWLVEKGFQLMSSEERNRLEWL